MNHRSLIKHFMKEKSTCINNVRKIALYWKKDYADIDKLNNHDVKTIFFELKNLILKFHIDDGDCCPQCIVYNNYSYGCSECSYGKRHGRCGEGSKYSKIVTTYGPTIVEIIGEETIRKYIKYNFNTHL